MELGEAKKTVKHIQDWIDPIGKNSIAIDTVLAHVGDLRLENARLKAAVRYSLATFRALERYTFGDSDHGLLIAEAVTKLEAANTGEGEKDELDSKR